MRKYKKGKYLICKICGKFFYVQKNQMKKCIPKFCSSPCFWKSRRFSRVKMNKGYYMVKNREHPRSNSSGYIMEHILIAEKHIGRLLKDGEVIHHINSDPSDNRIENLYLFPSIGSHHSYHGNVRYNNWEKITKSNL